MVLCLVDLVTLDDLSPEAMMESSERVGHLSDLYQRKCEPLSDPGPPGIMPPKVTPLYCPRIGPHDHNTALSLVHNTDLYHRCVVPGC